MYYVADKPRPHYVSIATDKQYFFKTGDNGADQLRALLQLERDDAPTPEPKIKIESPVPIVQGAFDPAMRVRMELDEMKLEQLRRKR